MHACVLLHCAPPTSPCLSQPNWAWPALLAVRPPSPFPPLRPLLLQFLEQFLLSPVRTEDPSEANLFYGPAFTDFYSGACVCLRVLEGWGMATGVWRCACLVAAPWSPLHD